MSWHVLVRPLAVVATGLIAYSAAEKGFRSGPKQANTEMALYDADVLMRETMTTSDDVLIDGFAKKLRNQFHYNTGALASLNRLWGGVKGTFSAVTDRIIPLGIAVGSIFAPPLLGAIGLGCLATWAGLNIVGNSALLKNRGSNVLDLKM
ncbi:MAG: hypothetical protein AB1782_07535 [Cyanobacteriota bacterium]